MLNTVIIEGRLTKDPELKTTPNGRFLPCHVHLRLFFLGRPDGNHCPTASG